MRQKATKMKKVGSSDIIEKKSRIQLEYIIPEEESDIHFWGGKTRHLDGIINFNNLDGSLSSTSAYFQLKGTETNKDYYDCDVKDLKFFRNHDLPVFLIFVNLKRNIVYWELIDSDFLISRLNIDIDKTTQKTKRVKFSNELREDNFNLLFKSANNYIKNRNKDSKERGFHNSLMKKLKKVRESKDEINSISKSEGLISFSKIKSGYKSQFDEFINKVLFYLGFVYLFRPFYLNKDKRKKEFIRGVLGINKDYEKLIIEELLSLELISINSNIVIVNNKDIGKAILDEMVSRDVIDLSETLKGFVN